MTGLHHKPFYAIFLVCFGVWSVATSASAHLAKLCRVQLLSILLPPIHVSYLTQSSVCAEGRIQRGEVVSVCVPRMRMRRVSTPLLPEDRV